MNNFISLAQAIAMTTTYRKNKEVILDPKYQGQDILPICETFDRSAFDALLAEADCTYIRVYLGMDEDLKLRVIAVGANSKNEDILPPAGQTKLDGGDGGGVIVEEGVRCPVICPPSSGLNP